MKNLLTAVTASALLAQAAAAEIRITEWMYQGAEGEFIEITNIGGAPIDLTGWSFDDDSRAPGTVDLSSLGVLAPGQSGVIAELDGALFRAAWGIDPAVPILGSNSVNLGRADEINIYDASATLVDRLTYGDQNFPGTIRTQNVSGWAFVSGPGPFGNVTPSWVLSTVADAQGSVASVGGDIGSPGRYVPAPGAVALAGLAGLMSARRRR